MMKFKGICKMCFAEAGQTYNQSSLHLEELPSFACLNTNILMLSLCQGKQRGLFAEAGVPFYKLVQLVNVTFIFGCMDLPVHAVPPWQKCCCPGGFYTLLEHIAK